MKIKVWSPDDRAEGMGDYTRWPSVPVLHYVLRITEGERYLDVPYAPGLSPEVMRNIYINAFKRWETG